MLVLDNTVVRGLTIAGTLKTEYPRLFRYEDVKANNSDLFSMPIKYSVLTQGIQDSMRATPINSRERVSINRVRAA